MVQKPIPAGVARSLARAKKFGKAHRPTMIDPVTKKRVVRPPGLVVFTLQDRYAPSVSFSGSAHETKVVLAKPGADGKPVVLATLKAGEKATFVATSAAAADGSVSVSWARQVAAPAPAAKAAPSGQPAKPEPAAKPA
jgi:hypothetical protein